MDLNEHQELVDVIRGVHEKLRSELRASGNYNEVWAEHLKNEELRKNYSLAMHKLATKIWKGKETRIEWTYKTCLDYFCNGGIVRCLIRERHIFLYDKNLLSSVNESEIEKDVSEENNYRNLNRKLKLLDVGSCYNPFSQFEEFSCTAIDLTPATKDVIQCDFLSAEIKPKPSEDAACCYNSSFFYEESFDIVVLSLVLEYLPACEQRAVFCYKSWQLLQRNGLCIIITPDSNNVNSNAKMVRSWKLAIEKIGFTRMKYDKLQHVHCMAFRKLKGDNDKIPNLDSISELLYIPQDFKIYTEKENVVERTDDENSHIYQNFLELPYDDLF